MTGTPGTGKSTLCLKIASEFEKKGFKSRIILVNDIIKDQKLYDAYDSKFDTYIIDDRKVLRYMRRYLEEVNVSEKYNFLIFETHTVSTVPKNCISQVIVLTARTDVLYDRLVARGYNTEKINENMECEIMRIVLEEAVERFGEEKVTEFPSNVEEDLKDAVAEVSSSLDIS